MKKIPLIVIAGPTASGKTALAVELAENLGGEIVSADSMQIYKYMDIGTAKPTDTEKRGIPHYMMDFLDPSVNYSAADYCCAAHRIIADISVRKKLPILVGGTGLYIDSRVDDVRFGEVGSDETVRAELEETAKTSGAEKLHKMLAQIDPESAEKYHPNNVRRVIRAIEFYRVTGKTISEHNREEKHSRYCAAYFCINCDRDVLYDRINRRVDIMLAEGLENEVRGLLEKGYPRNCTAMQGIGYKEFFDYFDGKLRLTK